MTNGQAAGHDNWLVRCSSCTPDLAEAIRVWKNNIGKGGLKIFLKGGIKEGGCYSRNIYLYLFCLIVCLVL